MMTEHVDKFGLVKEMYNMKKICLVVFSALTIVLELLPCGTVCIFATSPTERVKETFSYLLPVFLRKTPMRHETCALAFAI